MKKESLDPVVIAHNNFIVETSMEAHSVILKRLHEYLPGEENGKKKWLLLGRIVAYIFTNHFHVSLNAIEKKIEE